jgi:N-acetylglutamate synthase-like GNAT family acetyltransferase
MKNKIEVIDLSAIPSAIPTLANWHYSQWSYLNPAKNIEKRIELLRRHLETNIIPTTFVAVVDDKVVGSASLVEHDMEDRLDLTPWLASVFVDPEFRDLGVGTKLVNKIIELAQENGNKEFYLYTPDKESFYRRIGWKTFEKREFHDENVTMMKFIFSQE